MSLKLRPLAAAFAGACLMLAPLAASGQATPGTTNELAYADIAGLAESAGLVVRAQVASTTRIEDQRAPGLTPGHGRFYVEAQTRTLLMGRSPLGESIRYLVDLPLDAKGKAPKLKKEDVLLFARAVPGRPGELQLVRPRAQLLWTPAREARLRSVLEALVAPDAPARITGVRELLFVPGTLAGQGETQIFLKTHDNSAASITVSHEQGQPPSGARRFPNWLRRWGGRPHPKRWNGTGSRASFLAILPLT
ncbi:hypothetical protein [Novosphingobium panipatense]|uniref:hypothetical protein n=1 Tax=Novosphingobium panipatense TaxID=428991 RepID=UPI003623B74F